MSSEKNYINPEFASAFQRVKEILIDLKDRIMPVKQGNAVNFRQNINDAIGTIPETDQETGVITKDGYGMSGAVFAMGEAVEKGLDNMDTALVEFTNDANEKFDAFTNEKNTALTNFTNEKNTALDNFKTEKNKALNDFKDEKDTALTNFGNEKTNALNAFKDEKDIALTNFGKALNDFTTEKTNVLNAFQTEKDTALNAFKDEKDTALVNFGNESKEALDNLQVSVDAKVKEAMEQATADANTAADRANSAAEGITNTFVCLAQENSSGTGSYPVTVDSEGNETKITQSQGAVWFKIVP